MQKPVSLEVEFEVIMNKMVKGMILELLIHISVRKTTLNARFATMHKALDFYNVDPIKFSPFHNTCTHLRAIGYYQNRIKVIVIFAV